ncbi:hypothetical protein ACIPSE_46610 [Streptomyces sp. NPDC090106]|uniref:hypothetical protein n=1 Tax=Streptomyces sp. NPDC090106 TaxID=3365946 RepID=UPI0038258CFD
MSMASRGESVPEQQRRIIVIGGRGAAAELPVKSRKQWCWICDQEVRLLRYTAALVGEQNEGAVFGLARESIFNELKKGPVRSIGGFARTVILNKARDHWRNSATRYNRELLVGETSMLEAALPIDLGAQARVEEMKDYAAELLTCLSSLELTAFVLMALDRLSSDDAARAINEMNGVNEEDVSHAIAKAEEAKKRGERRTALTDSQGRRVMTAENARQTVHRARTKLKERAAQMPLGLPAVD